MRRDNLYFRLSMIWLALLLVVIFTSGVWFE
jgi:hypothetical protein